MAAGDEASPEEQYHSVFRHLEYTMRHLDVYEEHEDLFETARDEALKAAQESRSMDSKLAREMSGLLHDLYKKAYAKADEKGEEFEEEEAATNKSWEEYTDELDSGNAPLVHKKSEKAYNESWEHAKETDQAASEEHEYQLDIQTIGEAWQAIRYLAPDPEDNVESDRTYQ